MSEEQKELFESNPARYRALSAPFASTKEAGEAIDAFWSDVKAARIKHRIPDVLVALAVNGLNEDGKEGRMMVSCAMGGGPYEEEVLAAFALGRAQLQRQEETSRLLSKSLKQLERTK
jgi:hypothetical protein